ncbi:MAG: anaerobic ribonucleoside-triphosphate reductase activating protein [Candidatus Hermodarchaeota archaeon]
MKNISLTMRLGGIIDISTKDIPELSSMVLFTVGCNFSCEYCHNKYLLHPNVGREYEIEELRDRISTNLLVSGVSITGGEPTLQPDLFEVCKEIRKIGKYLSIDTNGSNPEVIKKIAPFINRVALDIKGPPKQKKLQKITGVKANINKILETINFVNTQKETDFEIRTTFVGKLLDAEDIDDIIGFLKKIGFRGIFVLQQYQFFEGVGEEYKKVFAKPGHDSLVKIIEKYKHKDLPFKIFLRDDVVGYCNIDEV